MAETPRRGVLITRPEAEAAATAERVRRLGFDPVVAPVLQVRTRAIGWPDAIEAVVVTSGNALPAVAPLAHLPLLAVGDATAARARAAGFTRVESAGGAAEELAALVQARLPAGACLLLPSARGEGAALQAALHGRGYVVHRRCAYQVHPVAKMPEAAVDGIRSDRLHAALFLSARTALAFRGVLPPALRPHLGGVQALAIGAAVAAELTPLPWRQVRVSLAPTLEQVLALL